jgi:hypothetical protein
LGATPDHCPECGARFVRFATVIGRSSTQLANRFLIGTGYAGGAIFALLAVALTIMWPRSYWIGDVVSVRTVTPPAAVLADGSPALGRVLYFGSYLGRLQLCGFPSPARERILWHTPGRPSAAILRHAQAVDHSAGGFALSVGRAAGVFGIIMPYWAAMLACLAWPTAMLAMLLRRRRAHRSRGFETQPVPAPDDGTSPPRRWRASARRPLARSGRP